MAETQNADKLNSARPGSKSSSSASLKGNYVTLERLAPGHIPLLFDGLGLPKHNNLFDMIIGFPYIYKPEELGKHLFGYLHAHPELSIFVIRANPAHLGPPSPPNTGPRDAALGFIGYRLYPASRTVAWDDLVYAPVMQKTYASTEAHFLLLRFLFEAQEISYCRIWSKMNSKNAAVVRYAERTGYTYEGTLRKDNITRWGTRRDSAIVSMLDNEWPLAKKALMRWLDMSNYDADGKQLRTLDQLRALENRSLL